MGLSLDDLLSNDLGSVKAPERRSRSYQPPRSIETKAFEKTGIKNYK